MMPLRIILVIVLAVTGAVSVAHADESGIEYRPKTGVFLLEGFEHWVDTRYQFTDHGSNTGTANSNSHTLLEEYNFNLYSAIVDPDIFDSNLAGTIGFNQDWYNNAGTGYSTDGTQYQYLFNGNGLRKSKSPFIIDSSRQINTVATQYGPAYTTDTTTNSFMILLQNDMLPSSFHFVRNTLDTSGGGFDSNTASNTFSYSAQHTYGVSSTAFSGSISDGTSSIGDSHAINVSLTNALNWGTERRYSLLTSLQLQDSEYAGVPQDILTASENFTAPLGKALTFTAGCSISKSSTIDYLGQNSDTYSKAANAGLSHRLFESLVTSLTGKGSSDDILGGTETKYSGEAGLNYRKKLSEQNDLTAVVDYLYLVDDRQVASSITTVQDYLLPGVTRGSTITLPLSGALLKTVISITNRVNGALGITFTEWSDYTVNYALGTIFILPGGRIDNPASGSGMDLYISYTDFMDPSLKYAGRGLTASTNVTMFNGNYSLGLSYSQLNYTLLAGSAQNSLRDTRTVLAQFSGIKDNFSFRLAASNSMAGDLHYDIVEGTGQYNWDTVSLTGVERYSIYGPSQSSSAYRENSTQCTLSYIREFADFILFNASTNLSDVRNSLLKNNDNASLQLAAKIRINQLIVSIQGQTGWQFSGSAVTRDDLFKLMITRYF
ncbi:MAG: hypothetical protein ABSA86_12275 [Oryzomonas sp.]|jgi:hypothetical protein